MRKATTIFKSGNFLTARLRPQIPAIFSSSTICSKELKDPNYKKPKPFPYETKKYSYLQWWIDGTLKRFDENSKIVVVDGNIGAGKTSFAKELADHFDMKYIPEPSMDRWYVTPYGDDLRKLDPIMPVSFKSCDVKTFYQNPKHPNVAMFQMKMLLLRYIDYIEGLAHLFNTGQGIVFDRSVYSDIVFMEAMCEMGHVRKEARDHYLKVYNSCMEELLKPHLIIYLDITPEVALQRIKERNDPIEINSPVLTKEYLTVIDNTYKNNLLNTLSNHTDILNYDWNNYGDTEVVMEDVERIDLDTIDVYSDRLKDWYQEDDFDWGTLRYKYTNEQNKLLHYTLMFPLGVPELQHPRGEQIEYKEIVTKVRGMKYADGFNPEMGDKVLFKTCNRGYRDKLDYFAYLEN